MPELAGTTISRVHGIDLDGGLRRFGVFDGKRAVVLVFLSTDCPISNAGLPGLNHLAARHSRDLDVYGILSATHTTRTAAVVHRGEFEITFPVLFDASGELQRTYRPTHTPHAFVLDPTGRVVYSGAIDDRFTAVGRAQSRTRHHHLRDAVDATLAGKAVKTAITKPIGCLMERAPVANPTTNVTYERDIAPIVRANCASCHRPGRSAPFPLLDFADVTRHAAQIVEVTAAGSMPPWRPVASHGEFRNARGLSPREIGLLRTWEQNGKPRGEPGDELPTISPNEADWELDQPDVVLRMKRGFEVPADGPDCWQLFVFPNVVDEGRLVSAIEFRPGAAEVVHHVSFFIDANHAGRRLDALEPDEGYRGQGTGPVFRPLGAFRSWLPGSHPEPLPEGMGRPLPAGADLVVEVHYHPIGRAVLDRSEIGLHFAPRTARQLVGELQVMNTDLSIPPGDEAHRHRASMIVPVDLTLLDTAPHMHRLGQSMWAVATRPDRSVVPLVKINDWDLDWQGSYVYREPIRLPAGSRIDVEFVYDNSVANVQNPHSPPRRVHWGVGTSEEMGVCHFQYTCDTLSAFRRASRLFDDDVTRQWLAHYARNPGGKEHTEELPDIKRNEIEVLREVE